MWNVSGINLQMVEGDYGVSLPISVSGATFTNVDSLKLTVKKAVNGDALVEKTFDSIVQNTVTLTLTAEESALLPVGSYVYSLDWYQDGNFLCNIIPTALFKVVEKA